jgi:Fe-S-cluster containining protein
MPGFCAIGDIERIAEYLGASPDDDAWLQRYFQASDGSRNAKPDQSPGPGETPRQEPVPWIVPRQRDNGWCVFFDGNGCKVHPVSPFGCSRCDMHMGPKEATLRIKAACTEIVDAQEHTQTQSLQANYRTRHAMLTQAGCIAAPLQERRAAFGALLEDVYASTDESTPAKRLRRFIDSLSEPD